MLVDIGNRVVNTAQVLWIERLPDDARGLGRCRIHFVGGETLVAPVALETFARRCGELVPVPAGYSVVKATPPRLKEQDRSVLYEIEPVVAFRFDGEADLPLDVITARGTAGDHYAIVRPDGSCLDCNRDYESVDAYKASFSADYAADLSPAPDQAA